jgi:oligoribonuclease NrnB/cAMP/cGMP phosphodiesterase (DHH superfamily)
MRLVTRADLDGLTSAILLQEVEAIDQVDFAHPKDVQDGKVELSENDILANLPYDDRVALWFDHHLSQVDEGTRADIKGAFGLAPSAARVIAEYYKSPKFDRYAELLEATDRLDSANLTHDDIVDPQGWILIGYTIDPRTGLGAFKDYFRHVMELAKTKTASDILADPRVKEHVDKMRAENEAFKAHLLEASKRDGNVVITDVRGLKNLPSGNRFLIYDLFPETDVSVRIADGHDGSYCSIQVGHSILNRTCRTNVGDLMSRYGGGGHAGAGTCQPKTLETKRVLREIVAQLKNNG